MVTRRTVLKRGAALGLGGMLHGGVGWSRSDESVRMILPSVTHDTIALKVQSAPSNIAASLGSTKSPRSIRRRTGARSTPS
jgi:hypothetical protein